MPSQESDLHVFIHIFGREFSINGVLMPSGWWRLKNGRSWSKKKEFATTTQIFKDCLHFVCESVKRHKREGFYTCKN